MLCCVVLVVFALLGRCRARPSQVRPCHAIAWQTVRRCSNPLPCGAAHCATLPLPRPVVPFHATASQIMALPCLCYAVPCFAVAHRRSVSLVYAFAQRCPAGHCFAFAERCGAEPCHAFAIHRCAMHCRCSAMPCCAGLRLCCALRRPAMPLLDETVQVGAIATRQATTPSHQPTAARQQHHVGGRTQTLVWSGNSPCRFS